MSRRDEVSRREGMNRGDVGAEYYGRDGESRRDGVSRRERMSRRGGMSRRELGGRRGGKS